MRYRQFVNLMAVAGLSTALAQTQVDLHLQSKGVDFSNAVSTVPMKTGTIFPASCTVGQMFFLSNGAAGSNLYACTASNTWTLESGGSGSSGGGGSTTSLPDFTVAMSSSTVLTIGGSCTNTAPCKARFGNVVYSIIQSSIAAISAGSGTAYVYLTPDGNVNVGSTMTVACTRCNSVSGISAFPANTIPLATWAAAGGTWVTATGVDVRAFQSTIALVPQTGLTSTGSGGQTLLGVDTTVVGLQTSVPANSSAACTQGSWATDGSFYYLCIATNAWKRIALTSF